MKTLDQKERQLAYKREWRRRNKERINALLRLHYLENIDVERKRARDYYQRRTKLFRERQRLAVLTHYSNGKPMCFCCGETIIRFLTIDHIKNDGGFHRKTEIGNREIGPWLINRNFPRGFRVLCYNCNLGKSKNKGRCPHKELMKGAEMK